MRRSMLFMPGNNAGNILNAAVFGADAVILDLEDAVAHSEKDSARILTRHALAAMNFGSTEIIVRVNGLDTPFWKDDLDAIVPLRPHAIMQPKIHSAGDVRAVAERVGEIETRRGLAPGGVRLIPLIESARGIEAASSIATADERVDALYLGAEDLALNLKARRTPPGEEILYSRSRIVMAARAAGIDALDTPFLNTQDMDGLRNDAVRARNLGFSGKAAIYPMQVGIINEAFSPTAKEYAQALDILDIVRAAAANGKGVSVHNGKLLDGPLIAMAENTVRDYEAAEGRS